MSLLYDLVKKKFRIPTTPFVFNISNVAKFCREAKGWEEWGWEKLLELSDMTVPATDFWMEWSLEPDPELLIGNQMEKMGFFMRAEQKEDKKDSWKVGLIWFVLSRDGRVGMFTDDKWVTQADSAFWVGTFEIENGKLLSTSINEDGTEFDKKMTTRGLIPIFQTMMFLSMHRKSMTIENQGHSSRQVRRQSERSGIPLPTIFKVLKITGMGNGLNSTNENGTITPFHICRGHRMKATAEKPLFGKPWGVGIFWVKPHSRGKIENGIIEKTYEISSSLIQKSKQLENL